MPALRPIVAYQENGDRPFRKRYTLKSGETFKKGDFVTIDTNEDILEVSGADPASLLGIAAEDAANVVEAGWVVVEIANTGTVFRMQGTSAPTEDDVNQSYGIVEDSDGVYTVDVTDTVNTRFYVVDVDTVEEYFFVKVLDANRVIKA